MTIKELKKRADERWLTRPERHTYRAKQAQKRLREMGIRFMPQEAEEWTNEELRSILDRLIANGDYIVKMDLAKMGYGLERLIKDKEPCVREVAKNEKLKRSRGR